MAHFLKKIDYNAPSSHTLNSYFWAKFLRKNILGNNSTFL